MEAPLNPQPQENPAENNEGEEKGKEMSPWEQHSGVILIPRFDYNAPSSLLNHSHSGFLITCPIKREKSATKEAITILSTILSKHTVALNTDTCGSSGLFDVNSAPKRRKLSKEEIGQECSDEVKNKGTPDCGEVLKETALSNSEMEENEEKGPLSLVKLTRNGLLLLTFPSDCFLDPMNIVSDIFHSLDSGIQKPLKWCNRIFPIQATCRLSEASLHGVVSELVQNFIANRQNKDELPKKFAVAYNRRGVDETELKTHKSSTPKDSNLLSLLDRNKCFAVVASAVKGIIADSVVDLKSPEFAVIIELLPLSRVPNGSLVVGVSVLPHSLINTKPKLSVKPLILDAKKSY